MPALKRPCNRETTAMSQELDDLIQRTRIIERINRLFIATDNRDWEQVRQCFADSVLFDMSSMGAGEAQSLGPDEIINMWETGLKPLKSVHHQTGNHLVSINGKEADAFCYGIASHYLPNESGRNTRTFIGSYDFKLARADDDWKITRFTFNLKYMDGNADLENS